MQTKAAHGGADKDLMAQIAAAMAKCDADVEQARLAKEARENERMERAILAEVEARRRRRLYGI